MPRSPRNTLFAGLAVALTSCLDLTVPPSPGPGSVQGTLVYFRPGRASPQVAVGARVAIRSSSLSTVTNAEGYFRLEPVTQTSGTIVFSLDLDGDGRDDRQRALELSAVRSGPGRDVVLGTVTLGLNAVVVGKAVRGDLGNSLSGHAGTAVVVPEAPYATTTADDGSYLLPDMPEGELTVAYVRDGYDVVVQTLEARAGEESTLSRVMLTPLVGAAAPGRVIGRVVDGQAQPLAGARAIAARGGAQLAEVAADVDGRFVFSTLPSGLYDVAVTLPGRTTVLVRNVVRATGDTDLGDLVLAEGQSVLPDFAPLPGLDAGAPVDAGSPTDGGPPDAGTPDGGTPDGGTPDGGTPDGGTPDGGTPDGGTPDSGTPDGGTPDGATPVDAGTAVAVISPSPSAAVLDAPDDGGTEISLEVNGDLSQGEGPLRFRWESLTTGLVVDQNNEFSSRVRFYWVTAPQQATTGQIRLSVVTATGAVSPWTEAEVRFAFRPVAVLDPAVSTVGGEATLTSVGSSDPQGLPIVARRFGIVSGNAEVLPGNSPLERRVVARAPGMVVVFLEVENAMGISSRLDTARITFLSAVDAGVLLIDAGAPQVTVPGQTVNLQGSAFAPQSSVSASWSELTPGMPPISLVSNGLQASFVAPPVNGDQLRRFQLEVRAPAGCVGAAPACLVAVADTAVTIEDNLGPSATFSFSQLTSVNRFAALDIAFTEPISAAFSVTLRNTSTMINASINTLRVGPNRLRVFPTTGLDPGVTYSLSVTAEDSTPHANPATTVGTFIARRATARTPLIAPLGSTSPNPSHPSVLLVEPSTLYVAVRVAEPAPVTAIVYAPIDLTAPSPALTPSSLPAPMGLKKVPSSKKLQLVNGVVYAGLAVPDGAWSPTPAGGGLYAFENGAWARMNDSFSPTSLPGPMFSDGVSLFSAAMTPSNLRISRFNTSSRLWGDFISSPGVGEVLDAPSGTAGQLIAAGDHFNGVRHLVWQRPTLSVMYAAGAALAPLTPVEVFAASEQLVGVRTAVGEGTPYVGYSRKVTGTELVAVRGLGGGFNLMAVPGLSTTTAGFDLVAYGRYLWLVASSASRIFVWRKDVEFSTNTFELVDGLNPDQSINDPACQPANPEVSAFASGVWLTWSERCGTNPWQLVVMRVD